MKIFSKLAHNEKTKIYLLNKTTVFGLKLKAEMYKDFTFIHQMLASINFSFKWKSFKFFISYRKILEIEYFYNFLISNIFRYEIKDL